MTLPAHISDYQILTSSSANTLSDDVDKLIKEGWQPYGLPSVLSEAAHRAFVLYVQAMVKYQCPSPH